MSILGEALGTFIILTVGFIMIPMILTKIEEMRNKNDLEFINVKNRKIIPNYEDLRNRERGFEDLQLKK